MFHISTVSLCVPFHHLYNVVMIVLFYIISVFLAFLGLHPTVLPRSIFNFLGTNIKHDNIDCLSVLGAGGIFGLSVKPICEMVNLVTIYLQYSNLPFFVIVRVLNESRERESS